jgi:transposase
MEQLDLGDFSKFTKLDSISKEDLAEKYTHLEHEYLRAIKEIYKLKYQNLTESQLNLVMHEQLNSMRKELFGASSERYKKPTNKPETPKAPPAPKIKKPSERYPNIPIREVIIEMTTLPTCESCGSEMLKTSMTEDTEQLTVIPKKYEIILQKQVKYRCNCQACIVTSVAPPRIIPGSSYSDEMILDVALTKYCDLIPMERYAAMASRGGLIDLPPNSLIELTHQLAEFLKPAYFKIKNEILESRVLHADETPHKMLEGSDKKSWYLWGFSNQKYCFLENRDTRSGDVASDILKNSKCEILITDVFSGYKKAVRVSNTERLKSNKKAIKSAYCNAHARRYFYKSFKDYPEAQFYLDHYHEIYQLNDLAKDKPPPDVLKIREQMRERFLAMQKQASNELMMYPTSNQYGNALSYFLGNYVGLTLFLDEPEVAIDNNQQERLLRNHVVGRKTWYGTHSRRGAETASVLFTLVETCKLNHINPREYFRDLVTAMLAGKPAYLPV